MSLAMKVSAALGAALLFGMVGCNQSPQSTTPVKRGPSQASQQWAKITDGFVENYFRAQPFFAAQAGRHEFDGQLPDLSAHGIKREIARCTMRASRSRRSIRRPWSRTSASIANIC